MKDKANNAESNFLAEREKDADIHLLASIDRKLKRVRDIKFILTGSYAIEALTGQKNIHEDIDANIYSTRINISLPRVASAIEKFPELELYKRTNSRLEYDIIQNIDRGSVKKLEFQFNTSDSVPIVFAPLIDSRGEKFMFRVKSLPYAIATWSIRISGLATNPMRELKNSDIKQFKLLLLCDYDILEVLKIIKNHPQMPVGIEASKIFEQSKNKLTQVEEDKNGSMC